jgi:hypothetical protein
MSCSGLFGIRPEVVPGQDESVDICPTLLEGDSDRPNKFPKADIRSGTFRQIHQLNCHNIISVYTSKTLDRSVFSVYTGKYLVMGSTLSRLAGLSAPRSDQIISKFPCMA